MTTPEKSVEEIVEEFGNHIGHMDKMVEPHYIMCQKEKHEGEMCGCEVAHMLTEQKDWLTQTLQAERQKGEEMVEEAYNKGRQMMFPRDAVVGTEVHLPDLYHIKVWRLIEFADYPTQ